MNPQRFDKAIEAARLELAKIAGVRSVILFGSAARGSAREESDIDLLIDCERDSEDTVRDVLFDLDRRFNVTFTMVFYRESERHLFDTQFLESILRSGQALVGVLPRLTPKDLDLQPLRLVSYRARGLPAGKRAQLLRAIDGYRTAKRVGEKQYIFEKRGFLEKVGGWRVGRGAVVIPEEAADKFDSLLRRFGATRTMIPIWCQRP